MLTLLESRLACHPSAVVLTESGSADGEWAFPPSGGKVGLDVVLGVRISRDPIEERGGVNLYGFCINDSLDKIDILGLDIPKAEGEEKLLDALKELQGMCEKCKCHTSKCKLDASRIISWRGKPLDRSTFGNLVKKYAKLAGVERKVTCHVWRHTLATHLLKNNANLRHV